MAFIFVIRPPILLKNDQGPHKNDFNVNTFLKSVSTSKSRVTYDLDTNTTPHKIIGVVGSPVYLATPVSTAFRNLIFHCNFNF